MEPMKQLFIVNDYDRPEAKTIAEKRSNGQSYYIHPGLRGDKKYHGMTPSNPTPLEDFGIRWTIENGEIYGEQSDPSVATYKDGKPRKWQGETTFIFPIQ